MQFNFKTDPISIFNDYTSIQEPTISLEPTVGKNANNDSSSNNKEIC